MTKKAMTSKMNVAFGTRKFEGTSSATRTSGIPGYFPRTKTNSAMKARLMEFAASTRPTVKKKIVWSLACASGWRATPEISALPATPSPMAAPMAPPPSASPPAINSARGLDRGYQFWVLQPSISPWVVSVVEQTLWLDKLLWLSENSRLDAGTLSGPSQEWWHTRGPRTRGCPRQAVECASASPIAVPKYNSVSKAKMNAWMRPMNRSKIFQPTLGSHRGCRRAAA